MAAQTILITSSLAGAGRTTVAAAVAYRLARDGKVVALARLAGDTSDAADAAAFAAVPGVSSPGVPLDVAAARSLTGDIAVIEAPVGSASNVAAELGARVLAVRSAEEAAGSADSAALDVVVTNAPVAAVSGIAGQQGVLAVLPEDRALAAPSVADIRLALDARHIAGAESGVIERVMIGTIASDAASPYFANREGTCVITRFDKTDLQLAALNTDLQCLVLTGGGDPSPYLLDRVAGHRPDVAVLLADQDTVRSMQAVEALYGKSRFSGEAKLLRAVELLDAAGCELPV